MNFFPQTLEEMISSEYTAIGLSIAGSASFFTAILAIASYACGSIGKGSYVLSSVHAISMLVLTSYILLFDCAFSGDDHCFFDAGINSAEQSWMLLVSVGYFIVDSTVVLFFVPDKEAAFHHLSIIVGQLAAVATGTCGYALAWFLFLAELSAPFLNCFLSGLTIEGTQTDFVVRALFAFSFIISRLLICPFMTYKFVLGCPNAPLVPKLVCLCVMAISLVWGKRVVLATFAALCPGERKSD